MKGLKEDYRNRPRVWKGSLGIQDFTKKINCAGFEIQIPLGSGIGQNWVQDAG